MFNNLKLSHKLYLGFGTMIVIASIIGLGGIINLANTKEAVLDASETLKLSVGISKARQQEKDFQLRGNALYGTDKETAEQKLKKIVDGISMELVIFRARSKNTTLNEQIGQMQDIVKSYQNAFNDYVKSWEKSQTILGGWREIGLRFTDDLVKLRSEMPEKKDIVTQTYIVENLFGLTRIAILYFIKDKTPERWVEFEKVGVSIKKEVQKLSELLTAELGDKKKAEKFLTQVDNYLGQSDVFRANEQDKFKIEDTIVNIARSFEDIAKVMLADREKSMNTTLARAQLLISLFCVLGLIIGMILATAITRTIERPIQMVANQLIGSSSQMAMASGKLSEASTKISSSTTEQASSIEETAASLQEIGGMISNNLKNAESVLKTAEAVKDASQRGNTSMTALVKAMEEILQSNGEVANIVKVINEIGEKTKVIDEIVFQTKLLSFNASVEAERAGEHGRGFAVVAQEVGNLAQMSGKAALEISEIVKNSIKNVERVTVDNRTRVTRSNDVLKETAKFLVTIVEHSQVVTQNSGQVVNASREQASGINQINKAIEQFNKTTQENAAAAEETASTSEELRGQAKSTKDLVGKLQELILGRKAVVQETQELTPAALPTPQLPNQEKPVAA